MSLRKASNLLASSQLVTPVRGVESNLWAVPALSHAEDDEFDSDVLDSSWNVYESFNPITAGSFSHGTVDPYDTSFTSGTVLRVDVNNGRPSWLSMQQPANGSTTTFFRVTKAYTLPTNILVWSRIKFSQYTGTATDDDASIGLMINLDDTGDPDPINSVELFLNESDSGIQRCRFWKRVSGSTTQIGNTLDVDYQGQALEYVAIHKIGTTYHGWAGTGAGNWIWMGSSTFSGTFAHVGFFVSQHSNNKPAPMITGVDFIRFQETDKFLL